MKTPTRNDMGRIMAMAMGSWATAALSIPWGVPKPPTEDEKQWEELRAEFDRQDEEEASLKAYRTVRANLLSNAERFEKRAKELRKLANDLPFGHSPTPKGIDWDEQPLGEMPDADLAQRLGVKL